MRRCRRTDSLPRPNPHASVCGIAHEIHAAIRLYDGTDSNSGAVSGHGGALHVVPPHDGRCAPDKRISPPHLNCVNGKHVVRVIAQAKRVGVWRRRQRGKRVGRSYLVPHLSRRIDRVQLDKDKQRRRRAWNSERQRDVLKVVDTRAAHGVGLGEHKLYASSNDVRKQQELASADTAIPTIRVIDDVIQGKSRGGLAWGLRCSRRH